MPIDGPGVRLGDLLTTAELLKPADLREAMLIAKQQGLPVGRVLIMSGYLSEPQLQATIKAQSMMKDGLVGKDTGIEALKLVAKDGITFDVALSKLRWQEESGILTNKLGELIVAAGILTEEDIRQSISQCESIGLPLGRVLVVTGKVSEEALANILNAQVLIRDGKITREQAIKGLRQAREKQEPIEKILTDLDKAATSSVSKSPNAGGIRLGELLVGASLIDQSNLMNAVEIGLFKDKLVGQVLSQLGLVNQEDLSAALELQRLVSSRLTQSQDAIEALRLVHSQHLTAQEALSKIEDDKKAKPDVKTPLSLYQFLQIAKLISGKDIENAIRCGSQDSEIMGRMILHSGLLDENLVNASKEALNLLASGSLTSEQAIVSIQICQNKKVSLKQAINELGWSKPSENSANLLDKVSESSMGNEKEKAAPTKKNLIDLMPKAGHKE